MIDLAEMAVLIVDDIMTSRATIVSSIQKIQEFSPKSVSVVTIFKN